MVGLHKGQKKYNETVNNSFGLLPGDKVRVMNAKENFEKEKARFSQEIYTIKEQVGYRFVLIDEKGSIVKRKYRANELLKVGEVTERLGKEKEEVEKKHKKINRTRRATGKNYEEATLAIAKKDEPREKRIKKKVTKLDL